DAAAAGDPFRIAILDHQMPGTDGEELGREILDDRALRDTLLVMLTSAGHRGDAARMLAVGFSAYLVKPVRQSQLLDTLRTALGAREQDDAAREAGTPRAPLPTGPPRGRVLVAEDNAVNQKVAQRMLERLGCRVDLAANGREAVEMLEL